MTRAFVQSHVWTNTEDVILQAAVAKYGLHQWFPVSTMLKGKTPAECKSRWFEYLSPNVRKEAWSVEEEQKLLQLLKALPNQWQTIASQLGRTTQSCIAKYKYLSRVALGQIRPGEGPDGTEQDTGNKSTNSTSATAPSHMDKFDYNSRLENRAARPDAHDYDETERELLQTAQARIANTAGKKEKRKLRDMALKDAKEASKLAHLRQLEAAGVKVRDKKMGKMIEMGEAVKLPGVREEIFDTTQERLNERNERDTTSFIGKSAADIEGLSLSQKREVEKQKQMKKEEELKTKNVAAYVMKQALLNDNIILHQRGELMLPSLGGDVDLAMQRQQQQPQIKQSVEIATSLAQPTKRKLLQEHDDSSSSSLQPTSVAMNDVDGNDDGVMIGGSLVKRTKFQINSVDSLLTSLDTPNPTTRANAIAGLAGKLSSLPGMGNSDLLNKLGALPGATQQENQNNQNNQNAQKDPSLTKKSTQSLPTLTSRTKPSLIQNTNQIPSRSVIDAAIGNLDADLKQKIVKHQRTMQSHQLSLQATTAKNAPLLQPIPPLPRLLDTSYALKWPGQSLGRQGDGFDHKNMGDELGNNNTNDGLGNKNPTQCLLDEYSLTMQDQRDIADMLQGEFVGLLRVDMVNASLDVNTLNDIKMAREMVLKEERQQAKIRQGSQNNALHHNDTSSSSNHNLSSTQLSLDINAKPFQHNDPTRQAVFFDPKTSSFIAMSRDDGDENKPTVLRQQALLYHKWLSDLLYDKKSAPHGEALPHPTAGKLKQLEQQVQVEFRGYNRKNNQLLTEFKQKYEKTRELFHDYSFYAMLQQDDTKSIEYRADYWSSLLDALSKQHQDLQELYAKLKSDNDDYHTTSTQ